MLKMQKWWEKVNFMMSYYKIVGIGIKMKIIKNLECIFCIKDIKKGKN